MGQKRTSLFDHDVGAADEGIGYLESECFSSLEVDGQSDLCCLLDRQVSWPLAFQYPAGIYPGQSVRILTIHSVAKQSAGGREIIDACDRRYSMASS